MMKLYVIDDYKDVYPHLSGRELTDALIGRCLGREDVRITRDEKGKPSVTFPEGCAPAEGNFISVSHSEGTFALIVSDRNVGLDIQYARKIDSGKIARRYFSEEEAAYIAADGSGDRFFELWTRKEAYSKYTGLGMEQIMTKVPVLSREDVIFTSFRLEDGCFCTVCAESRKGADQDEIQISYGE